MGAGAGVAGTSVSSCPAQLLFDAGRRYRKGERGVFRFILRNTGMAEIESPEIEVSGESLDNPKAVASPTSLGPGQATQLDITGFLPTVAGDDVLRVRVHFSAAGEERYLIGTVDVHVLPAQQGGQVNVHLQSGGPMAVDASGMVNLPAQQESPPAAPVWIPVAIGVDSERQKSADEYFPPPLLTFEQTGLTGPAGLACAPVGTARVQCLTVDAKERYLVVAGDTLVLGRNRGACHIGLRLYPDNALNQRTSLTMSGQHCTIKIDGRQATLLDTSRYGTQLDGRVLGNGIERRLWDGAEIGIVNALRLQVRLFTDGRGLAAVRLDRVGNETNEHYLLIPRFAAVGPDSASVVPLAGSGVSWVLYCDPADTVWKLRAVPRTSGSPTDTVLGTGEEISLGGHSVQLSSLQQGTAS